jgi:hypothetical protein
VHYDWHDVNRTYGYGTEQMPSTDISDYVSYVQHTRVKDVYIRRFDTNTTGTIEEVQDLFDVARERLGESRAEALRKLVDLNNASRGLYVSKTGKLPDTGGLLGPDYDEFASVRDAFRNKGSPLPGARMIDGIPHAYTYSYIVKLVAENEGKPLFIPSVRKGSWLRHGDYRGQKGFVIQFSPFLFPHGNGIIASVCDRKKYLYYREWDLANKTK